VIATGTVAGFTSNCGKALGGNIRGIDKCFKGGSITNGVVAIKTSVNFIRCGDMIAVDHVFTH
jgi:hypothetical protein